MSDNPAEGYEGYMVPTLFGPWAAELIRSAKPGPGDQVLDVGCGTGIVARLVAKDVGADGRVVGVDVNPGMLEVARAAAQREGIDVEWREGPAEKLPFPDDSFDLVLCQFALMFFVDRGAALAEMRRVLKDGGRVGLSVWQSIGRHPFYETLDSVIQQRVGISGVRDIFALCDVDELRKLLAEAGLDDIEVDAVSLTARFPNPDGFLSGEIDVDTAAIPSMQKLDSAERQAITSAISEQMKAPLRAVTEGDHVVLPFHAHIARAVVRIG